MHIKLIKSNLLGGSSDAMFFASLYDCNGKKVKDIKSEDVVNDLLEQLKIEVKEGSLILTNNN